ncbi:MAG: adenylate/guanylate cyclase domain-containing protein, partial [Candidatus Binatia bacterium]
MRCVSCGLDNREGAKFCNECGCAFALYCKSCGTTNPGEAKFCSECGSLLAPHSQSPVSRSQLPTFDPQTLNSGLKDSRHSDGERRQLTVMFCDLVGSTALSAQLDPEELRLIIQAYRETCATVIRRFDGHLAKYIGDGLLVYFGYPLAHEDDAQRAVRAGLEIIEALQSRTRQQAANVPLPYGRGSEVLPLQVRIGIHTGLVVAGEMGVGDQPEPLGIVGETPNIAARLQGLAEPDTVVISEATCRLVEGLFECRDRELQEIKGLSTPLTLYRVVRESGLQSRFAVAVRRGLTPLVGREEELELLRRRWEQAKVGAGQVVLLSGEPGIGKSRLVETMRERVEHEGAACLEFHGSPYHQNSALYPIIDYLQRALQFGRDDSPTTKLEKLQQRLSRYRFPRPDTPSLLAALLSLPFPEHSPPLAMSPQKQKQMTQDALVAWFVEETEEGPVYSVWEDLHWADPSSLAVLKLLLNQAPPIRLLTVVTFRPEFHLPWEIRSYMSQLTLNRLGRQHVKAMVERMTNERTALSTEVMQQIVRKTDGVPLFVEELTKTVMESGFDLEARRAAPPLLSIPATLQDSLMARLDRLGAAKEVAQLGATLGREFNYEFLRALSSLDDSALQQELQQLVKAELLYQRGLPPQAAYLFKHALIQDAAYQSLLKNTRRHYHQQIAQMLQKRFPDVQETQPELVAHHYTEAGLIVQAIPYWLQAGQRATQHSAPAEAISHLTRGLELLKTLPDTSERAQQELSLQLALGVPLMATKGYADPGVEHAYSRARVLCQQGRDTPHLFPALLGLCGFYLVRAELTTARELGEQCLSLARREHRPDRFLGSHHMLGLISFYCGDFVPAQAHFEQVRSLYEPQRHRPNAFRFGQDPGMASLSHATLALWALGYPDQALKKSSEAVTLTRELSHPFNLAGTLIWAVCWLHFLRRDVQAVRE